ncbi:MAG: ferritin-like domain-containing protein [Chitinophagaceae bacterium]
MEKTPSKTRKKQTSSRTNGNASSENMNEKDTLLQEFFVDSLKDIYWAEKHLTKALPKMAKAATTDELMQAFEAHLQQTQEHVSRLEQVFEMIDKKAQAKKCEAMEGLTKEADEIIDETEDGTKTRDVALIMAAQKVEHYEIATYGSLVQIANTMGLNDVSEILGETLQEEKDTDSRLTDIAENNINWEAQQEGDGQSSENGEEA